MPVTQLQVVLILLLFLLSNTPVWGAGPCYDSSVAYGGLGLFFGFVIGLSIGSIRS